MKYFTVRSAATPLFLTGSIATALVFAATGCGSGGGNSPAANGSAVSLPVSSLPATSASAAAAYAGRSYSGSFTLANGQTGNVTVLTSGTGAASGRLEIVDPTRKATAKTRIVIATPFLSGTFDPTTGAISLTGSYVDANGQTIPISITGTLPVPPSTTGGSLTVTVNGQSYTTTFGGGTTNPTPTPSPSGSATPNPTPSASASPTPSPSPTPTPSPASGAVQFTLVSKSADCNFADPGISGFSIVDARYANAAGQLYQFTSTIQGANRNTGSFTLGWQLHHSGGNFVPETFTFVSEPQIGPFGDDFQGILQTGVTIQTGALSVGAWRPTGGTLTVVSVNGKKVTVHGEKVEFTPTPSPGTNGKGSFIADFTVTYDSVSGL